MKRPILILIVLLSYQAVSACSCIREKRMMTGDIENATSIFVGKVIDVKEDKAAHTRTAYFLVQEYIYPFTGGADTVGIETPLDGSACGLGFASGDLWYIVPYNGLRAGLCGRSLHLNRYRDEHCQLLPTDKYGRRADREIWTTFNRDLRFIERFIRKKNNAG